MAFDVPVDTVYGILTGREDKIEAALEAAGTTAPNGARTLTPSDPACLKPPSAAVTYRQRNTSK